MLSQRMLEKLRVIMVEEFGIELDDQLLSNFGNNLVGFCALLRNVQLRDLEELKDEEDKSSNN